MTSSLKTPYQIKAAAEREFQDRLRDTHRLFLCNRLPDTSDVRAGGRNKAGHLESQPGDFIVHLSDAPLFIAEVKGTTNATGFSFTGSHLRPKQLTWIKHIADFGYAQSYYVILRSFATNEWFKIPATAMPRFLGRTVKFADLQEFTWTI